MRNETEFIKSTPKRYLTAKAQKFTDRCISIACEQRGYTRYYAEMKPLKAKITKLLNSLFIDKGMSIKEIKQLIKDRDLLKLNQ
jgi:hypothetical protein|tara:strand:+ start:756 stop:1007 length:252 start_codon:yes stop_codon:yes gene_type:complete